MANNSKSRLFTPSVVRRIISSNAPVVKQTAASLSGSVGKSLDRTFKLDGPGDGIKSTQQLNVDWSKFENHTFFNSAEAKVNVAFDTIINNFPFDGTRQETEDFFNTLTGYEKYVYDLFPKNTGCLNFVGENYVDVIDRAGALFPSLAKKKSENVLDPGEESISFETHIFLPSGEPRDLDEDVEHYNGNQIICQKLDALGLTGFTLGILDSRLKNKLIQETDSEDNLLWYVPNGAPDDPLTSDIDESYDILSAAEAGYTGAYDSTDVLRPSVAIGSPNSDFWPEIKWAAFRGYEPVFVEQKLGLKSCDLIFLASSGSNYVSASMELPRGEWSHICATYDREPGQNNIKLYLNGELASVSQKSYNMATFSSVIDPASIHPSLEPVSFRNSSLTIGTGAIHFHGDYSKINEVDWASVDASHDSIPDDRYVDMVPSSLLSQETDNSPLGVVRNCFLPNEYFSGSLDNFRIWHSARTKESINSTMKCNVYAGTPGDLRLSYTFNEPEGEYSSKDLILDSSGNSLHARISNFSADCKDESINLNPASGILGDPDDTIRANIPLEKMSMNPVLFPSYPDIVSFNKDMLDKASWYDTNNPNIITNLIPKHYLLEGQSDGGFAELFNEAELSDYQYDVPGGNQISAPQIMKSLLFTWARYFDEIKMFLDHFSNLMNVDYESTETIPENFLPFLSNYYGIKLPKTFTDASLEQYLEGENITPDQGISELSLQFVQNQIWRRILVNINEILQSKGTVHGIRALMLSMGISPDKLFRFREYGGSRTKTLDDVRKKRVEVSSMLDFSGTLAGVNNHREAPGVGNPFAYIHKPLVNPWEADFVADELSSYTESPFITPFIMSPFLSGSRVEVGPCLADTNIPVAVATLTLDYSLPSDSAYGDVMPRYRESAGYLADEKLLDKKAIYLKDIDKNEFVLQFKGTDETIISSEKIEVDIRGISDRIDISQKLVEVINEKTSFLAYNISELNDGIISIHQPRGGRAGNYPISLLQYVDDKPVPWNGLIQAVDEFENKLWKRPDSETGIVQLTDIDGNNIHTSDSGTSFNNDPTDDVVYQAPLSALGYSSTPQVKVFNSIGTAEIGVWKHITTGKLITYEDHPGYADTVFSDNDMGPPYEPLLTEQSEESYALEHGYVPVYNRKEYLSFTGFSSGLYGMIDKDHPDLSEEESLFIKENGNFHGFNQTRTDGLFTSGSWAAEAIYKFDKPHMTFYPVTQSLMRINSTVGAAGAENHVLLANLVCTREPEFDQETGKEIIGTDGTVKLYLRPEFNVGASAKELVLEVTGVNIFNGKKWNISYGRERADQIGSAVSSSYYLRVAHNGSGEIQRYLEDKQLFLETLHNDKKTFWSDLDTNKNDWGAFITIGSQSLPSPADVLNLGLNNSDSSIEQMCTHFSGEVAQLRFWSKALTEKETKEHCRNPLSIGVQNPTSNFNFTTTPEGSFERLRLDVSFDQPVTASIEDEAADEVFRNASADGGEYDMSPLGWFQLFDFSQAEVSGSRGAIWRPETSQDPMKFHMYGYGFEAEVSNIKPERFDYQTIDAKFDEQSVDNKVRVRGFQLTHNIEEFQTDVAPVHEILPSETPSDDTRFSIDISAVQGLNDDIAKIFATLESMDNIIGSPELVFTQNYPDLEFLREVYFNRLEGKVRVKAFFEFFKWFDNAVGDIIKTLVPRKTHFLGVNFVVESHMLERAKMTYNYSDVYLGEKNRHGLKGTMTLQQFVGKVKRF